MTKSLSARAGSLMAGDSTPSKFSYLRFLRDVGDLPLSVLILTVGRLLLIPVIILTFEDAPVGALLVLVLFIAADLYDGVLARDLDVDSPPRRILDSLVDRVAIWTVYLAVTLAGLLPPVLFVLLVGRDLYCGRLCSRIIRERNVVIRADWMYRLLNTMLGFWVVVASLVGTGPRVGLFLGILAFSGVVAADLRASVGAILRMPPSVTSTAISATSMRRVRGSKFRTLPALASVHSA